MDIKLKLDQSIINEKKRNPFLKRNPQIANQHKVFLNIAIKKLVNGNFEKLKTN